MKQEANIDLGSFAEYVEEESYTLSCGNVFEDLQLPDADRLFALAGFIGLLKKRRKALKRLCPYGYSHKPNAETIKAINEPRIHAGSSFEDFLKEMGIYEQVEQAVEERLHMDDIKTRGKVAVEIKSTHQFSVEQEEDGTWWGQSDDFPGIFVQADTLDERELLTT